VILFGLTIGGQNPSPHVGKLREIVVGWHPFYTVVRSTLGGEQDFLISGRSSSICREIFNFFIHITAYNHRTVTIMSLRAFIKKLEVPHDGGVVPDRWINNDIKPIEKERRTWNFWTFHNLCR
jgi:hypothetical protein